MTGKIIEIAVRSVATYIILLVLGRIIGRKLISRITFYDFIVGVTLGSIAVRIALGSQESPFLAALSIIIITVLVVITDYLSIKSFKFRVLVDGEPMILISSGKILNNNLKKMRISINELMMQLREKDIFNIEDVEFAIIESDGQLTVLPKTNKQPITTGDLNISVNYTGLTSDLIIDGKIIYDNLKVNNHNEKWLRKELKLHNIHNIEDVFYAGIDAAGTLYVSVKKNK